MEELDYCQYATIFESGDFHIKYMFEQFVKDYPKASFNDFLKWYEEKD